MNLRALGVVLMAYVGGSLMQMGLCLSEQTGEGPLTAVTVAGGVLTFTAGVLSAFAWRRKTS